MLLKRTRDITKFQVGQMAFLSSANSARLRLIIVRLHQSWGKCHDQSMMSVTGTRRKNDGLPWIYHPVQIASFIFFYFYFFLIISTFNYYLFIYLAVLGLRFCARAFSSCGKRGPLFIAVRGPLTIVASLVAEHRLQMRRLSSCGSRA